MKKRLKKISQWSLHGVYSKIRERKKNNIRKNAQQKAVREYLNNHSIKKLQIGCGANFLENWLNTDLNDSSGAVFLDAGEKFPLPDKSFDFIYSEHIFEHLTPLQQKNMLLEGHRILKKDGVMRIATPSLDFLWDLYAQPFKPEHENYVRWAMDNIPQLKQIKEEMEAQTTYHCYVINHFFKAWGHQMIHNFASLRELASQAGFVNVREEKVGNSDESAFLNIEKHGNVIPEEMNLLETMIIELKK